MVKTHEVYYPIYANKNKFTILVAGGRASGKSYFMSSFLERLAFKITSVDKIMCQILYTRYVMVSASISIIPEFLEKAELDGTQKYFRSTRSDVVNRMTESTVMLKGLKTSLEGQTAELRSIRGITILAADEVEEWMSGKEFETIVLSMRQKGIQNGIFVIASPTDNNHWVYRRLIENAHKEVTYDGISAWINTHSSVLYIHTTYLDSLENLSQEFINEMENMKASDPEKYIHTVMGKWTDVAGGAVFKYIGVVKEFPKWCKKVAIGLDFDYTNDVSVAMMCGMTDDNFYVDELFY